jgi:cyclic beta-1,2-glucan synthetase
MEKPGLPYLNILEEQVNKTGLDVSEIISKEHFGIAKAKVSLGNSIISIKQILRMDILDIFEHINGVEEILKKDPLDVYSKMDNKTKEYYRTRIGELSTKTKTSEIYIANKALELALRDSTASKYRHVGYYLIGDGLNELMKILIEKERLKPVKQKEKKAKRYIDSCVIVPLILSIIGAIFFYNSGFSHAETIAVLIILYIPISEIYIQILNYILSKIVKPKLIPKMDFYEGVPEECATFVVIPTIIKTKEKVQELMKKLEVYYIANKSENLYFALLGDASSSNKKYEEYDEEISKFGVDVVNKLNEKYKTNSFPKFHFIYRKRVWNNSEKTYLGWERKRGLLCQFNSFLLTKKDEFRVNTINHLEPEIPKIKYVITLDSDTNLVLNTGLELIGAMAHVLNAPVLNKSQDVVIEGHALMQPRIGIDLKSSRKSIFTKIYAGLGGVDSYTNAVSDIYQDNFDEGIFTGKGIYDLEVFDKVLCEEIPENTVLSHDLLEGSYLRCALVSDILLLDGFPYKYNAYVSRAVRWIRGDWQILYWLKNKIKNSKGIYKLNPLNRLSKFKILDNLRRSLINIFIFLLIAFWVYMYAAKGINVWQVFALAITSLVIPTCINILNYIVFKKEVGSGFVTAHRSFAKRITSLQSSFLRAIFEIMNFPHKAYSFFIAICKTIYRMKISRHHLLEWLTAEEAEAVAKSDTLSYYKTMYINIIFAVLGLYFSYQLSSITLLVLSILWLIAPACMCYTSKEIKTKKGVLKKDEIDYLINVGEKTWGYFKKYVNEENNFLPPDNYQEDRTEQVVKRTSSTNIGLGVLSVISAYDLGYIKIGECIDTIYNMVGTIEKLIKWNGHLYNWYNTKTLEPLLPRYISTVDSGNFIGYMYVLKEFLESHKDNKKVQEMLFLVNNIIEKTDFKVLYDYKKRLFSIGFNIEENKLTDSYYDLLASEARQASLVAIAKKDIPAKHWYNLSRVLTTLNRYKGLISWSGTAFEYLMPNVNMARYESSLLDESCKFMIMSQQEYAKKLGIPWGISESAFNLRDLNNNYQYKAFGVPWLGLKRGLADDMVVSSYGLMLALPDEPKKVVENLKILEKEGMLDKFGFYEALDYTSSRLKYGQKNAAVKTYMAHHQGLILLSINNFINDNILQTRFKKNPEIEAVDILLQERMPEKAIITKEKKEKVEKVRLKDYENYTEVVYTKPNNLLPRTNIISNGNYTICTTDKLEGFSECNNILVNRFKETADIAQGIMFYIKNVNSKRIWTNSYSNYLDKPDKYAVYFSPDKTKCVRVDGGIETTTLITIAPDDNVEIRRLELKNSGTKEEILEITSCFEPVLSTKEQDYAHQAFNNLFLTYEFEEDFLIAKRKKRSPNEKDRYCAVGLFTEDEVVGELEYEIDKDKFFGRNNISVPVMVKDSKPFTKSLGLASDSLIAMKRTIKIEPNQKVTLDLIVGVANNKEDALSMTSKYKNPVTITETFGLSFARNEAESIYLSLKGKDIELYQKMLSYLIFNNPLKYAEMAKLPKNKYKQSEFWKYGISGDFPILLLEIKDINDLYMVKEVLAAYEYFRAKGIRIDLIILDKEENIYEQYVKEGIEGAILNKQMAFLKNNGIYILNSKTMKKEDKNLLRFRANLILNARNGHIEAQLKEMEEDYIEQQVNIGIDSIDNYIEEDEIKIDENIESLKYYNEYGGFSADGSEYIMKINKDNNTPIVWSHILANEKFGTVVTDNLGGYTWNDNSRLNRITAFNNSPITDVPSEIIYIKDRETGKSIRLGAKDSEYVLTYGFGYVKYKSASFGVVQELDIFVPEKDKAKVNLLTLTNKTEKKKELKLVYYVKPVLGEDETNTTGYINLEKNMNVIYAENLYSLSNQNRVVYVGTSEKIKSYTGNKKTFIGNKTIENPESISKVSLDNKNALGQNACIAIEINVDLEPYETKEISFVLGEEYNLVEAKNFAYKYSNISNCKEELSNIKKYWFELLGKIKVKTPIESVNIILNGWAVYQTIVSRLWGKTGYYQSGGATGFRDQLQDTLGLKYIDTNIMKNQILKHAAHQFKEGDVEHWWHTETNMGIRTRFSDDLLWLPYVVAEYINFTGDWTILNEQIPYIDGDPLADGEDEKYNVHLASETVGTIYEHSIKAIEKSLDFGENGLPKIGSGDWSDGLNTVGNKGKGESVWLGFFLYDILVKFESICENENEKDRGEKYSKIKDSLKRALNTNGWDGRWFKRAFTDDGFVLGSIENEECRIDSLPQSWSVISNAGDNDKKFISMESLENHLIDKENGIIKLLDPPFDKDKLEPGYIKAYLPGVRENGGQYTHARCLDNNCFFKIGLW